VRIVSPFAAGGSSDTMSRIVAENLSQRMHQQFYIENRGGAGGLIGSAAVANAPPDGTTFLISSIGTHVIAPAKSANPGYDPIGSFAHVGIRRCSDIEGARLSRSGGDHVVRIRGAGGTA
jgi:tripartite-type tricarboxylate transporter receptor subunit TctC